MAEGYLYLFGPVPSRRLGRSLGIDIVPLKTCSYNCVYCQLGATPRTTAERRRYVDPAAVLAEFDRFRAGGAAVDFATFSGSGEPTLNSDLGLFIREAKARLACRVAVLTNGSLLWEPAVRRDLAGADVVCPTLTAADPETFRRVHRQHDAIDFQRMVEGLIAFTREFKGEVWLEVFLVEGLNTAPERVAGLRALIERIGPKRVQLNTAVRPPAEPDVRPMSFERLEELRTVLGPKAELIPSPRLLHEAGRAAADADRLLAAIARHPATAGDLAAALRMNVTEVQSALDALQSNGRVTASRRGDEVYYSSQKTM